MSSLLEAFVAGLRATSTAELVAVASGLAYALLAVRRDHRCWLFGGCSSALLAWLAARADLPMQAVLQSLYVLLAAYGYWSWTGAGARDGAAVARTVAIGAWPARRHAALLAVIGVLTVLLAPLVARYSDAAWPRIDTATTLASLLATWMVARQLLENWLYWIVIDAISAFLYGAQGLLFAAALYVVYLLVAIVGYVTWRRLRIGLAASG